MPRPPLPILGRPADFSGVNEVLLKKLLRTAKLKVAEYRFVAKLADAPDARVFLVVGKDAAVAAGVAKKSAKMADLVNREHVVGDVSFVPIYGTSYILNQPMIVAAKAAAAVIHANILHQQRS